MTASVFDRFKVELAAQGRNFSNQKKPFWGYVSKVTGKQILISGLFPRLFDNGKELAIPVSKIGSLTRIDLVVASPEAQKEIEASRRILAAMSGRSLQQKN